MSNVALKQNVIQWAMDRSNQSVDDLLSKFPKIKEWVSGQSHPTLKQVENLARATLTPLGMLFLDEPPVDTLPVPLFRTLSDAPILEPSPNLVETFQLMERRQAWMREYLIEEGEDPVAFVRSSLITETVAVVAQRIRDTLGFSENWATSHATWTEALRALREATEASGVLVVVNGIVGNNTSRKLNVEEFRGFVLVDEYAPLVFINGADGKAAQMFTLAHEIAHVFFGLSAVFDLAQLASSQDATETACNKVAAEFLVPENSLRSAWNSVKDKEDRYQLLAKQFKVSELVAARRALDLRLSDQDEFRHFYGQYEKGELKKPAAKGGDFYASQAFKVGNRFATAVVRAVHEGKLLYSEAYALTGMYGKTFETFSESYSY